MKTTEIEICFGKQISTVLMRPSSDLSQRVAKMRRKFAKQYGFVVPEIKLAEDLSVPPKSYQIKVHGTVVASAELRLGDVLVVVGDGPKPDAPGDETREPAFGMKAIWVPDIFTNALKRDGFVPGREYIRASDARCRSHPQQSCATLVVSRFALASRPARSGISQAA